MHLTEMRAAPHCTIRQSQTGCPSAALPRVCPGLAHPALAAATSAVLQVDWWLCRASVAWKIAHEADDYSTCCRQGHQWESEHFSSCHNRSEVGDHLRYLVDSHPESWGAHAGLVESLHSGSTVSRMTWRSGHSEACQTAEAAGLSQQARHPESITLQV